MRRLQNVMVRHSAYLVYNLTCGGAEHGGQGQGAGEGGGGRGGGEGGPVEQEPWVSYISTLG